MQILRMPGRTRPILHTPKLKKLLVEACNDTLTNLWSCRSMIYNDTEKQPGIQRLPSTYSDYSDDQYEEDDDCKRV